MKKFHLFLALSGCAAGVLAQAAPPRPQAVSAQAQPDLRRSELREALKKPQQQVPGQTTGEAGALGHFDRRLSEQERADLRQQLRQLNADSLLDVGAK